MVAILLELLLSMMPLQGVVTTYGVTGGRGSHHHREVLVARGLRRHSGPSSRGEGVRSPAEVGLHRKPLVHLAKAADPLHRRSNSCCSRWGCRMLAWLVVAVVAEGEVLVVRNLAEAAAGSLVVVDCCCWFVDRTSYPFQMV